MYKEPFIYNLEVTLPQSATGTSFTDAFLMIDSDSDFTIKKTIHVATDDRINLKLFDEQTGRFLFKGAEDLRAISGKTLSGSIGGNGFVPFIWPLPYKISRKTQLKMSGAEFANTVGDNTLRMSFHGDKMIDGEAPYDIVSKKASVPIIYESPSIVTAAPLNSEQAGVLQIDNDSDFLCYKITGRSTGAGTISIQDMTSNKYWQNIPTHVSNLFGDGQFPNILTSPRFIAKNSRLYITFKNLTASANTLNLYLHGEKRF